jgi:hypothetical protein
MEHRQKLIQNQLTEAEQIKGRNGRSIFNDWHQPEEPEDCSREDIARSYRLRRGF